MKAIKWRKPTAKKVAEKRAKTMRQQRAGQLRNLAYRLVAVLDRPEGPKVLYGETRETLLIQVAIAIGLIDDHLPTYSGTDRRTGRQKQRQGDRQQLVSDVLDTAEALRLVRVTRKPGVYGVDLPPTRELWRVYLADGSVRANYVPDTLDASPWYETDTSVDRIPKTPTGGLLQTIWRWS